MQKGDPLPDRIGPYRVQRQLSATGSALVYLAREEGPMGFARDVVLKLVPNPSAEDAEAVKEVTREATICARLNHPGIVRTYQFFEHAGTLVLVLEHVDGMSLAELLSPPAAPAERLSDDAVLYLGVSILDALAHAHAMVDEHGTSTPVVHRAVSPSNVIVGRDGTVKLAGFGFAKILEGSPDTKTSLNWEPVYMAPEQATESRVTTRWDVYAAGVILWELLSGKSSLTLPTHPLAIQETLRRVAERKLAPLAELRRDLPRELVAAVDAALVNSPEKRTIGCAEMAQWIRKIGRIGRGKKELRDRVSARLSARAKSGVRAQPEQAKRTSLAAAAPGAASPAARTSTRQATLLGIAPDPALLAAASAPVREPPAANTGRQPRPSGNAMRSAPQPAAVVPAVDLAIVAPSPVIAVAGLPTAPEALPPAALASSGPAASAAYGSNATDPFARTMPLAEPLPAFALPAEHATSAPVAPFAPAGRHTTLARLIDAARRLRWPSFIERLRAPTAYRRTPWLFAWIALGVAALALLVWRPSSSSTPRAPLASAPVPPSSFDPRVAPSGVALPPADGLAPSPMATTAASARETEEIPQLRSLGYLTVHSASPYAKVYVQLWKYGRVEDVLIVPCGKRFVSIGIPTRKGREPIWLAPGKMIVIPCGGLLEVTMDPRKVK